MVVNVDSAMAWRVWLGTGVGGECKTGSGGDATTYKRP